MKHACVYLPLRARDDVLIARSRIFNMDFFAKPKFMYENIKIERIEDHDEYRRRLEIIKENKVSQNTGMITIEIPKEIESLDQAEEYSKKKLDNLWILLSFAHEHQVFWHGLEIVEVDGEEIVKRSTYTAIWTGKAGYFCAHMLSPYLEEFLKSAMPLLENEEFISRTNIRHALLLYNLAQNFTFIEIRFQLFWMALEGMANVYTRIEPIEPPLTKDEWNGFKKVLEDYLDKIGKKEALSEVIRHFSFIREPVARDKINHLLRHHNLSQYSNEIGPFLNIRRALFHGRSVDIPPHDFSIAVRKLEGLLEKILFKFLNFYENEMIHPSIKSEDLLAR